MRFVSELGAVIPVLWLTGFVPALVFLRPRLIWGIWCFDSIYSANSDFLAFKQPMASPRQGYRLQK